MPEPLRIAGASGFWGDRNDALLDQLRGDPVDVSARSSATSSRACRRSTSCCAAPSRAEGFVSLRLDTQGKTYGYALLRMEVDVPDDLPVERLV